MQNHPSALNRTFQTFICFICSLALVLAGKPLSAFDTIPWGGGPVIQNPRIVVIYWGTPDSGLSGSLNRFYSQIVQVPYLDRLFEYSTGAVRPITIPGNFFGFRDWFGNPEEQIMGGGSYVGSYVIQPAQTGNVETTDIGPQLDHEIHVGNIPGPDRNTIYMIHFSPKIILYLGTNLLGIPVGAKTGEGFCAYHAAYYSNYTSRSIVYGAIPNQAVVPSCLRQRAPVDAETYNASHELVEAATDPGSAVIAGGFLSVGIEGSDQAWRIANGYNPQEIADRCGPAYLRTSPNPLDNYLVSESWSNQSGACTLSRPIGSMDTIHRDGSGAYHVQGWALDPLSPATSIQVHLYFGGPYPYGRGYATVASVNRPDVNTGTGYPGTHGFDFVIPPDFDDAAAHSVYAYGIGVTPGNNAFLGNAPLSFNSLLNVQSASQPVMIASRQNTGQCLDITAASIRPGTQLQMYSCTGAFNQRFLYHPDTQELKTYDNSYCVDASSGLGKNGDHLILWPCNGDPNQKWRFNLDSLEIRGVEDKCVDANAGNVGNTSPVQIWSCNGGTNQRWFRK